MAELVANEKSQLGDAETLGTEDEFTTSSRGRARKSNVKYAEAKVDPELRQALHQRTSSIKKKPKPKGKVNNPNHDDEWVGKRGGGKPKENNDWDVKNMSSSEKRSHAIEEAVIKRTTDQKDREALRWSYKHRLLPDGAEHVPDIQAAVKKSVKESTKLLTDWNQNPANFIGKTCKVYWDGDKTWFYARIIYYDANHGRHFVYYLSDATAEWLVIQDETIMIAEDIVIVKKGAIAWPAMQYWLSSSARNVVSKMKQYKKGTEYIEYFAETQQGKRDYGFVHSNTIYPISDASQFMSKKPSLTLLKTMEQAQVEQEAVDSCINSVLSYIRKNLYTVQSGEDWIGTRVRAVTHRIPWIQIARKFALDAEEKHLELELERQEKERLEKLHDINYNMNACIKGPALKVENIILAPRKRTSTTAAEDKAADDAREKLKKSTIKKNNVLNTSDYVDSSDMTRCVGTIAKYCPSIDKHLVVFDEEALQPQWVTVNPDDVDVLVGPTNSEEHSMSFLRAIEDDTSGAYCGLCGCGQEHIDCPADENVKIVLQKCKVCQHSYHPFCIPGPDANDKDFGEVRHTKSVAELIKINATYNQQHKPDNNLSAESAIHMKMEADNSSSSSSSSTGKEMTLSESNKGPTTQQSDTTDDFVCWKCIPCETCGQQGSAWNRPQHCWNLSRVANNAPEEPKSRLSNGFTTVTK